MICAVERNRLQSCFTQPSSIVYLPPDVQAHMTKSTFSVIDNRAAEAAGLATDNDFAFAEATVPAGSDIAKTKAALLENVSYYVNLSRFRIV